MATVEIRNVRKAFGSVEVLHGVSVDMADGEFVVLVGPSGCGKSTLLRMLAGLENITAGEIAIGGKVVNAVPPKDRDIAMVFQNYALYPHMTVYDNMAFSLTLAKAPKEAMDREVGRAAKILGLEQLLQRYPRQLSGGQRQRVAMGRAIVRNPQVFLFDEPLSNLDAKLRVQMRSEIKELHQRLKVTTVYVTHDQIEAMTMADKIVVMNNGNIEQVGAPLELYDRPANLFVAGFIGSPAMNMLKGTVTGGAFQRTRHGKADQFLSGFEPDLSTLWFSTFCGGADDDEGGARALEQRFGAQLQLPPECEGLERLARAVALREKEIVRIVLDPAGRRIVLLELALRRRDERAHHRCGIEGVTHRHLVHGGREALEELLGPVLHDDEALGGDARLPVVLHTRLDRRRHDGAGGRLRDGVLHPAVGEFLADLHLRGVPDQRPRLRLRAGAIGRTARRDHHNPVDPVDPERRRADHRVRAAGCAAHDPVGP